jgi:hypothetical protein
MRPLCGLVEDGCEIRDSDGKGNGSGRESSRDERGGITKWGGRCNDLLGTRCDPYGMLLFDADCRDSFAVYSSNSICAGADVQERVH